MMAPMIYTPGTLSVLNTASSRAWRAACRMYTYAVPCCFKAPVRKEGQRIVTRFQLQDDIEEEICSSDPWIILHKIDSPTKMRYIGSKVASWASAGARLRQHLRLQLPQVQLLVALHGSLTAQLPEDSAQVRPGLLA